MTRIENRFEGTPVIVTGATGGLGSEVLKQLEGAGAQTNNVLLYGVRDRNKLEGLGLDGAGYQVSEGGLWEKEVVDLPEQFQGSDAVMFNIASNAEDAQIPDEDKPGKTKFRYTEAEQLAMSAEEIAYVGRLLEGFRGRIAHVGSLTEVIQDLLPARMQFAYGAKKSEISKMMDASGREDLDRIVAGYFEGGLMDGTPEDAIKTTNFAVKMAKRTVSKLPEGDEKRKRGDYLAARMAEISIMGLPEQVRALSPTEVAQLLVTKAGERTEGGSYTAILGDALLDIEDYPEPGERMD